MTKRSSRVLLLYYLLGHGLTLLTLLLACIYLGYYLRLASVTDEFGCTLKVGMLAADPYIPEKVQCKLIAVGVFSLLRSVPRWHHLPLPLSLLLILLSHLLPLLFLLPQP